MTKKNTNEAIQKSTYGHKMNIMLKEFKSPKKNENGNQFRMSNSWNLIKRKEKKRKPKKLKKMKIQKKKVLKKQQQQKNQHSIYEGCKSNTQQL